MNIFKSYTLKWWQVSLFKIAMVSLGVAIGATWPEIFIRWTPVLWLLFITLAIYISYIWLKQ